MAKICYICGGPATSKEHAPAKSFFPEEEKYRKNLITVRSCSKHNEDTSKDDEYVRNIISMSIGNNPVAFKQFMDKSLESLKQSEGLLKSTTNVSKRVYTNESGKIEPTLAFQIDRERFDNVIKKIAYALFFNDFKCSWNRGLIVMTEFLVNSDMSQDDYGALIQIAKKYLNEPSFDGNNPQVFKYKFMETESPDKKDQILWLKFYEGFEIFVSPKEGTNEPEL
jgi:hypothetical protein